MDMTGFHWQVFPETKSGPGNNFKTAILFSSAGRTRLVRLCACLQVTGLLKMAIGILTENLNWIWAQVGTLISPLGVGG